MSNSIGNTLLLGVMAATAGTILAGLIAYISQRQLVRGHQIMSFLATVPIAIPGIVLAIGLFHAPAPSADRIAPSDAWVAAALTMHSARSSINIAAWQIDRSRKTRARR